MVLRGRAATPVDPAEPSMADKLIPTPSQTVGPFFHLGLDRPEWADLTARQPPGRAHRDRGPRPRRRRRAGARRADRDVAGQRRRPLRPSRRQAGRQAARPEFPRLWPGRDRSEGEFRFVTIKPGPVPGRGNALQAPHINVALFARGLLRQLYTRIYFADETRKTATIRCLSVDRRPAAPRRPCIAARDPRGGSPPIYRFDIVLQGENETVFSIFEPYSSCPPSTEMVWPVTQLASGEARNSDDLRHLLGPAQPAERDAAQDRVVEAAGCRSCASPTLPPGNSIEPGATQLTRMPFFASSGRLALRVLDHRRLDRAVRRRARRGAQSPRSTRC